LARSKLTHAENQSRLLRTLKVEAASIPRTMVKTATPENTPGAVAEFAALRDVDIRYCDLLRLTL